MKSYDDDKSTKIKNNNNIANSFDNAINGIVESVNSERNMLFHIITAILVLGVSFFLDFTRVELIIVGITAVFVIVAELFNTSIEVLTDLSTEGKYHPLAKKVKDIAAGAVLMASISAVFVGYLLIYPKVKQSFNSSAVIIRIMKNKEHLALLSVGTVLLSTLLLKGLFFKKDTTHLFGGSVSGHTSLAFNLATIGALLSGSGVVSAILFLLAAIVAESRVESKIHTLKEVIFGAILGIVIALLFFFITL